MFRGTARGPMVTGSGVALYDHQFFIRSYPPLPMASPFGESLPRREDPKLLTGDVQYTDDIQVPNSLFMAIHRSQHAHAAIRDIDTTDATELDSVVAVFTAEDVLDEAERTGFIPGQSSLTAYDSEGVSTNVLSPLITPKRPLLATDRVRYQGEPIAVVIAKTQYAAQDGANLIDVDYERLNGVTAPSKARGEDAPTLHDESEDNTAFIAEIGDAESVDRKFAGADHIVETSIGHQRVAPTPIEPRAAIARPGSTLEVVMSTQTPHTHRNLIARVLGIPAETVRVRAPAVGGGFGGKMNDYPAEILTAWSARALNRPISWRATRSEQFLADAHGRGHDSRGRLALDDKGEILALEVQTTASLGAYTSGRGPRILTTPLIAMLPGQYNIDPVHARVTGMFTNSAPIGPYRGTSRTRATLLVEHLIWKAAQALHLDPVELRRKNLVDSDDFPFRSTVGTFYDSGDYLQALETATEVVDYDSVRREQSLRDDNVLIGIGISCGIDEGGSSSPESGRIRVDQEGKITAYCGTADQGQGHLTTFTQIVARTFDIPPSEIDLVEGDTDAVEEGAGTYGSRSAFQGGTALELAAEEVVEQARSRAGDHFEASREDITYSEGEFSVKGVPERSISIQSLSERTGGFEAEMSFSPKDQTLPSMTHAAVVEIDRQTGELGIRKYVAVDDVGKQINPIIVEGQVHGGVAQGIGQALWESIEYDNLGNLTSATFMDYSMPRSHTLPDIQTQMQETPSPATPLGIKGVGESGTIAAPAAVVNAIADALAPQDLDPIRLPLTEERIWQAIQN